MTTASMAMPLAGPAGVPGGWLAAALRGLRAALANDIAQQPARPSDSVQIRLLRQRDPDAWHALFATEMPAIFRYVHARLGNAPDAEELTSQVFEEAWKHADAIEDRGVPPRAWLYGIARHVVASHRRRWLRRPPHLELGALDGASGGTTASAEMIDLAAGIAALPARQAEVVTLRFIHGLSLEETAEVVGASIDAVKGRQARALADLRDRLATRVDAGTT